MTRMGGIRSLSFLPVDRNEYPDPAGSKIRRLALTSSPAEIVACAGCDLLQRVPQLPSNTRVRCQRCGESLGASSSDFERPLALSVAAAIMLVVANTAPLMGLRAAGREASTTLIGGAFQMWLQGQQITAIVVAICAVIAPAIYIAFMLILLLAMLRPRVPRWAAEALRWAQLVRPWSMDEVMMLGVLVALTKIAQLAEVIPGPGMYAVFVLILLLAAIMTTFDPREVWRRVQWVDDTQPSVRDVSN
jgi:paraquat-inducible protein A